MRLRVGLLMLAMLVLSLSSGCFLAADGQFYSDEDCRKLQDSQSAGSGFVHWLGGCP